VEILAIDRSDEGPRQRLFELLEDGVSFVFELRDRLSNLVRASSLRKAASSSAARLATALWRSRSV
jgi:hypothetical protein